MFTDSERRGARVIAIILALGTLTDLWRAQHPVVHPLPAGPASAMRAAPDSTARAAPRPLDLNTASAAELDALPGIGPVLAGRIVTRRHEIGAFHTVDELQAVPGIGPRLLDRLRPLVRVASVPRGER